MSLKAPSRLRIYEALTAISDDRVRMPSPHTAKVEESDQSRTYTVRWDPSEDMVACDDEDTRKGKIGYPIVAFLMLKGILPYDPGLASRLKGIDWRRLEDTYKDHDEVIRGVVKKWDTPNRKRLERFVHWTIDMLSDLDMEPMAERTKLSDFTQV